MMTTHDFVTEVEDAIARGTARQRCEILRRVTDMFVLGSHRYSDEEIDLLDDVFERLAAEIEASARSLLAMRLAPIRNAPPRIIRTLAIDDAADVACPILIQCERLPDATLVEVAREKSQEHLFAISRRPTISAAVTDILVDRGDQLVVLSIAENRGARLSDFGFSTLVKRAEGEDRLAASVGAPPEIPPHLFAKLLAKASHTVRARLEAAHPNAHRRGRANRRAGRRSAAGGEDRGVAFLRQCQGLDRAAVPVKPARRQPAGRLRACRPDRRSRRRARAALRAFAADGRARADCRNARTRC